MIELPRPLYYLIFAWVVANTVYEASRHDWPAVIGTVIAVGMGWLIGRTLRKGEDDE